MTRRTLIALLLFLLAGGGLASLVAPAPGALDDAPQRIQTAEALGRRQGVELAAARATPLLAGLASVAVAVPAGSPVGGYLQLWPRRARQPGEIAVGALLLASAERALAITTVDAVTVSPLLFQEIRRRTPAELALVTTASHVHTGPGGCGHGLLERLFLGPADPALREALGRAHGEAIRAALDALEPAQLLLGRGQAEALLVNRSERGARLDGSVDVLGVLGGSGWLGRLISFAAHPTLIADRRRIDGDYPARLRQHLDELLGGRSLFAAGATGSASARRPDTGDAAAATGVALAQAVAEQIPLRAQPRELALGWQRVELSLPAPRFPLWPGWVLRPWLSRRLLPGSVPIDLVRLGDALLAVLPGELSAELSSALRQRCDSAGVQLLLTSHNGVYAGYFMPAARYGQPGPERALELHGPGTGELLVALLAGVCTGLGATDAAPPVPDLP